jgi:hypothetical protein
MKKHLDTGLRRYDMNKYLDTGFHRYDLENTR